MSIYVLRYGDLYKIGFSSRLTGRIREIMNGIPGEVSFVGHMPGDRDVEQHLHRQFQSLRFSGEWFADGPELQAFCRSILDPTIPVEIDRRTLNKGWERTDWPKWTKVLRDLAKREWPETRHSIRRKRLVEALGWSAPRVKAIYYAERVDTSLTTQEQRDLDRVFGARVAETSD